ncbi:MAG: hypothetical protein CM15mL5_2370 [uncultured marine virus]|nr:MAG: hypothetical protein CM15mL5_2370 [uncultured marine virus]
MASESLCLDVMLLPMTLLKNLQCVLQNESDWTEIHNYIINENDIDDIPNRKDKLHEDMPNFSPKRAVYSMSVNEANILRNHSKVEWVEQSTMYNPVVLEQRKLRMRYLINILTSIDLG